MPYSRRTLLRDAGLLSLAGLTAGCKKRPEESAMAVPKTSGPFEDGIRIFFSGAWLFCPDAPVGMMRAISVDMAGNGHKFAYGNWQMGFDSTAKGLVPNPHGNDPHLVTLPGYTASLRNVDDLFSATSKAYTFTYLHNPKVGQGSAYHVDDMPVAIRIISLPIPTRIRPAAYVAGETLKDLSGGNLDTTTPAVPIAGVASAHIFDYAGATKLSFKTSDGISDSCGLNGHYHFHTVPNSIDHTPDKMLHNLQSLLLNNYLVELDNVPSGKPSFLDPPLPDGVSDYELDERAYATPQYDMASCAGGGIGLGGDCC